MLAATSSNTNIAPESLQVALRILSADRDLPDALNDYLRGVITQAKMIVADPSAINSETLPEAIQLALGILHSDSLRSVIDGADTQKSVSPAVAKGILEAERGFAATA